jgi:hypothetical protein
LSHPARIYDSGPFGESVKQLYTAWLKDSETE